MIAPLVSGTLMDQHQYQGVFVGLALVQAVLIASAFNVARKLRCSPLLCAAMPLT